MDRAAFRRRLTERRPILVPGCLDPLAARQCEALGFEAGYVSGGALGYSLAVSEALLTLSEVRDLAAAITRRSSLPIIVDGGVGFGDAVHVARTVWDIEATGAVAIELEDQVAPKRVSHHRGIEHHLPTEEMVSKIEVAVQARRDPDFVIIARTGAVITEGLESAVARCQAYLAAGADAVLIHKLLSVGGPEVWRQTTDTLDGPLATFELFDRFTVDEWQDFGVAMVIDPMTPQVVQHQALRDLFEPQLRGEKSAYDQQRIWDGYQDLATEAGLDPMYEIERGTTEKGEPAGE